VRFRLARDVAELADEWYVLSAFHGVVPPQTILQPYNLSLDELSEPKFQKWVSDVKLWVEEHPAKRFIIFASGRYARAFETVPNAEFPLRGLGIGEQQKRLVEMRAQGAL
jgi:cytoplasmic iron level regulating protein YaaA (DUF328/UPF0246 family)